MRFLAFVLSVFLLLLASGILRADEVCPVLNFAKPFTGQKVLSTKLMKPTAGGKFEGFKQQVKITNPVSCLGDYWSYSSDETALCQHFGYESAVSKSMMICFFPENCGNWNLRKQVNGFISKARAKKMAELTRDRSGALKLNFRKTTDGISELVCERTEIFPEPKSLEEIIGRPAQP